MVVLAYNDNGNINGAEHSKFICLLENPVFALEERDMAVQRDEVANPCQDCQDISPKIERYMRINNRRAF